MGSSVRVAPSAWLTIVAVAGLSGAPAESLERARPATTGRIRIELLDRDGSVLAYGEAISDLTPM
jgi:hypothetical protein